jgi:hypothetical protein
MTPLIDTIEQAFIRAVQDAATNGGEVRSDTVVDAIKQYSKGAPLIEVEWAVTVAYGQARFDYGNEWTQYPGHVAEFVVEALHENDAL